MANVSDWKGCERLVAEALGGKRRLRTMESFGKKATDVFFPKEKRKLYPKLNHVQVEVKKRKRMPIQSTFVVSKLKYCTKPEDRLILATKLPSPKKWKKARKVFAKLAKLSKEETKHLKRRNLIETLVTVDLSYFTELFDAWSRFQPQRFPRG